MKKLLLIALLALAMSGCTCKEWGYCPHLFPDASRFASNNDSCPLAS